MAQVPLTPDPQSGYTSAKTPEGHLPTHEVKAGVSSWSSRYRIVGNLAQSLIMGSMILYVFGQLAYFTPIYKEDLTTTFRSWWNVPKVQVKGGPKGNPEMVMPTYFTLFTVLPIIVSALLIEFLRHFNMRRISSHYMLKFALVLRRKPAFFGKVSYWSYGEWIFFWGVVGGNIYVFLHFYISRVERMKTRVKGGLKFNNYLESVALTLGFSCIFNMAFLFLPATRNCVWMEFFNISYANGIKYHRWLGVITVLTAIVHCAGYYWSWIRQGTWQAQSLPCFNCNLGERKGLKVWFNVFGELALIVFLLIGVTSIPIVRRKFYNLFYYTHQLLFLGVIFSIMHWAPIIWWILPSFLLYCFSRAMSASNSFTPVEVSELTAIADDLVKVVIKRSPGRDGHFKVGQFLYLNVPAISKLQWHAFTISSSPRTSPTTVTVLLKSLGDWTQDLVTYANDCKDKNVLPTVYVDGYYGASLELYDEYSTVCLVGGGIGATPMFAILEDLAAKLANHETLQQKVVFIFSFRELALLEEVHPVLMRLKELDPQEQYFKTHFYLTRVPSDDVLAQIIDTERLQGKHIRPTQYDSKAATSSAMAFYEPLRSRTYKALAMLTVLVGGLLVIIYMRYGGEKIERKNEALWPLQQFVEPVLLMMVACLVFAYVYAERLSKRKTVLTGGSKEMELNVFQAVGTPAFTISDVHTYGDLVNHYNVVMGERPNTKALMAEAFEFHQDASVVTYGKPVIGVFVSGPEAMKRAVEYAAHEVGTSHFDIHEEEFEL